jgi:hypothetical protein
MSKKLLGIWTLTFGVKSLKIPILKNDNSGWFCVRVVLMVAVGEELHLSLKGKGPYTIYKTDSNNMGLRSPNNAFYSKADSRSV